jgi:hypothetical protein
MLCAVVPYGRKAAMPSLHLDIPSIDWIERTPRGDEPGKGKPRPASEEPARPSHDGLAKQARGREARDAEPWPDGLAGAVA